MKNKIEKLTVILILILSISACKKKKNNIKEDNISNNTNNTEILGCTDYYAYNFDSNATSSDNSMCTYIKTTMYEITHHAEFNNSGGSWDNLINTKADLILKIKEEGASEWLFESNVKNNHPHNEVAQWQAPNAEILKNKNYEWKLFDDETIGSDELMASGVFNPMKLTNSNNEIITKYTDSNGLETQLKIYYFIQ